MHSHVSRAHGNPSGAPANPQETNHSTIFDVDPRVGRVLGADDPKLTTKPYLVSRSTQGGVPPPVDVSDTPQPRSSTAKNIFGVEAEPGQRPQNVDSEEAAAERLEGILERMREALRARGAVGIRGLARNFQICDVSKDRKLQKDELQKCLGLCRIKLSVPDFDMLFSHCDGIRAAEQSGPCRCVPLLTSPAFEHLRAQPTRAVM